ncbi:MAG: hypothetical protein ACRYHQ_11855 [Janthinobacterium lividum]
MVDDLAPPERSPVRGHARYVVVRDRDGRRTAVAPRAVSAVCETDEGGALLLLPGGRVVHVEESLDVVLGWLG